MVLLKRVVALAGERIGFDNGKLTINGKPLNEPYVVLNSKWNLSERAVRSGNIYVVEN